jgi:putative flippase GtrA
MLNSGRAVALRQHPTAQRFARFALTAIVAQGAYASLLALFLLGFGYPRQTALAISYVITLLIHFTLNRQFVFAKGNFKRGLSAQGARYLVIAASAYVITALGLALLPEALGIAPYFAWALLTTVIGTVNFAILGRFVFR